MSTFLRIIFIGTPEFAAYHLDRLISSGHNIIGVFTRPDTTSGRGKKLTQSPVKILAKKKIPVFQPISLLHQESQKIFSDLRADIIIVVAYGLILPKIILDMPHLGCINVHGSLLPRWRGAAPIQRSILAGDSETGVTIIKMNTELDTGDILYKESCPISDEETSITLCKKLAELGSKGLIETLEKIAKNSITYETQDESMVTYAKKLSKSEARIDWGLTSVQIERCIRAFNPWPISWIEIHGQPIKVWKASAIKILLNAKPGTIIESNKNGIQIATIEGILNLEILQLAGKQPMNVKDILNSHRGWFVPGTCLS